MKLERRGKRVTVRPCKLSDYNAWKTALLAMSPKARNSFDNIVTDKTRINKSEYRKHLAMINRSQKADEGLSLGVFLKDGTLVGGFFLSGICRYGYQSAHMVCHIYNNHWDKGYGRECALLAFDIAFKELNLHRLEAAIEPGNRRSINSVKAIGMKRDGYGRRRMYIRGEWRDMVLFAAFSEDYGVVWRPRK